MKKCIQVVIIILFALFILFAPACGINANASETNCDSTNKVSVNDTLLDNVTLYKPSFLFLTNSYLKNKSLSIEEIIKINKLEMAYNEKLEKERLEKEASRKYVALTFDDGPSNKTTLQILDLLDKYNATATFFEIGYLVDKYPEIVKAEYEAGCEIGNHTYNHINMKKNTYKKVVNEINMCNEAIYNATGEYPSLLRPPYGNIYKSPIEDCNMYTITWSIDTLDWSSRDSKKILAKIYEENDLNGQVILMHSIYQSTVDALEELLQYLEDNNYQTVTVSELISKINEDEMDITKTYGYTYFKKHE